MSLPKKERPQPSEPRGINTVAGSSMGTRRKEIRFIATALSAPPANAGSLDYPAYQAGGSGTRGTIRDQQGNLIWRATQDYPVYSISISPDDGKLAVGAGDGNAYIITSKGEKIADLPQFPQEAGMLGFGNWVWLDNDRVLGESGTQNLDENGNSVECCVDHNMSENRFYVYNLKTMQIGEVQLPESLQGTAVSIGKILKTGEIQIGHEGDGFGWYQVTDFDGN